jgi:hypothetical protein
MMVFSCSPCFLPECIDESGMPKLPMTFQGILYQKASTPLEILIHADGKEDCKWEKEE